MKKSRQEAGLAAAAFVAACCLTPIGAAAQTPRGECGTELNFADAEIQAVIDEIALRTGRTFLLDPRVQGRVTVKSPPGGTLCADEAWELFQAMLRVNGFNATPLGGDKYKIVSIQESARAAGPVGVEDLRGGDVVTEIVRLRHVDAREAAANLAQIVGERGVVAPVRSGNAVIIVDSADNVARLKEVLSQLDRDTTVYRTIALNNASAGDVARIVSNLAREISEEGGVQGAPASVLAVEASNSILIRAEPALVTRLVGVIAELDRIGANKSDLSVIYLNHADAEEMAPLLRELAGAQETGANEGEPLTRSRAVITFHKPTNSIIISGDADIQRMLQNVVSQLDVRRAQVLVEAIIVEVSDSTSRDLGLQYFLSGTGGSRVPFSTTNFASAQPNILAAAGAALLESGVLPDNLSGEASGALQQAALNSLLGINGFALGGAGRIGERTIFGAILTAIKQDTRSNVLSTPSVVTLDNQSAELSVGQEIPITTGEAIGSDFANAFRTVSREEVGVKLSVTPQINEGGTVTLEITQETSSIAGQIIETSTDLITNKRVISTTALVDNGDILVIGGLIDDTREMRESKVPLLGDIPVAGNLFKTSSRGREQRNLMVFIRPTILRDQETARAATRKKLDYIRAQELMTGGPRTDIERLIEQVTGVDRPSADMRPNE